mmetsp:Transcript_26957/g.84637  ORF Transcript_26957/g.84637 Transcript_26957/m.84637 type:complete len:205 (-) Transcript_26957:7-621(-)
MRVHLAKARHRLGEEPLVEVHAFLVVEAVLVKVVPHGRESCREEAGLAPRTRISVHRQSPEGVERVHASLVLAVRVEHRPGHDARAAAPHTELGKIARHAITYDPFERLTDVTHTRVPHHCMPERRPVATNVTRCAVERLELVQRATLRVRLAAARLVSERASDRHFDEVKVLLAGRRQRSETCRPRRHCCFFFCHVYCGNTHI